MKRIILTLILILPLYIFSQELKKSDLFGEWKFKEIILISEPQRDSLIKQIKRWGQIDGGDYESLLKPSDIKFTQNGIYYSDNTSEFELGSDYWNLTSDNKIIVNRPVPDDMVDYFVKNTFNVVERLDNGKYYYQSPEPIRIIEFDKNKFIISDSAFKYIF